MPTKTGEQLLYEDLTYQIRGACFRIWKEFGGAFKEKVVDRALTEELKSRGFNVENQKRINIYYNGKKIAFYTPDKIVNNLILIEIKSKPFLTKEDERQFWYYLKGSNYKVGLLINFGSKKLEIKRRIYDKARNPIRVDPRVNPRLSASTNTSFTLIELLVSIFIIVLISGIILANYRVGGQQLALQRSANKLAQDIRRAQQMAMGAAEYSNCTGNPNYKYGWGIYLNSSSPNQYILFADCDNGKDYDSPGEAVGDPIPLEAGVKIKTLSPSSPLTITFTPPDPTITIFPSAPATITLGNDSQTKTITVNSAGLIEIQ
jgi:GxxExxY protein